MQTSIEWLIDRIKNQHLTLLSLDKLQEQAKEMHKEEHGKTWDKAIEAHENRGHNIARSWCDFDEYYEETFKKN